jgi:hypothetical protein
LKRTKTGLQDFTSLSLFVDDAERLLRDLYGDVESEAIEDVRQSILCVLLELTRHLRNDLWKEHDDAQNIDYVCGIGVPEGYGLSGSDYGDANRSARDIALRARIVDAIPAVFSKYTVEFVKVLSEEWPGVKNTPDVEPTDVEPTDVEPTDEELASDAEMDARISALVPR